MRSGNGARGLCVFPTEILETPHKTKQDGFISEMSTFAASKKNKNTSNWDASSHETSKRDQGCMITIGTFNYWPTIINQKWSSDAPNSPFMHKNINTIHRPIHH